jgi:hypothetical protein
VEEDLVDGKTGVGDGDVEVAGEVYDEAFGGRSYGGGIGGATGSGDRCKGIGGEGIDGAGGERADAVVTAVCDIESAGGVDGQRGGSEESLRGGGRGVEGGVAGIGVAADAATVVIAPAGVTLRMQLFWVSARNRFPAESKTAAEGALTLTPDAVPVSAEYPALPVLLPA